MAFSAAARSPYSASSRFGFPFALAGLDRRGAFNALAVWRSQLEHLRLHIAHRTRA